MADSIKQRAKKVEEAGARYKRELDEFKRKQRATLEKFRAELKERKLKEIRRSLGI